jgi:hypothetical protein
MPYYESKLQEYGSWILVTIALISLPCALVMRLLGPWLQRRRREQKDQRGFEVKLNSGKEPGMQRKDNDHG